ncbi:Granulocyte colony-stimulating factor receptor [Labeo rohita]|uniref:Granulocyte colony-stimulating factor receptor n=1 Tax=Labeo rohita TaxID=84645 RepID=A0ABQ8LZE7_LABRO|nr:Granulocyte colony-stimulating factor receptor [Labeo rohita]
MASVWHVLVLWIYLSTMIKVIQASCAKIHTPAPVVLAGSPVSVSCSFEDDCSLTKGKDFRVVWKIDNHNAPSDLSYQESNRTYVVTIPSLPDTGASIACAICEGNNCQIVNGVKVEAGYPPSVPKNLSCYLSLTFPQRILCRWVPGQEMASLPTNYTLQIFGVLQKVQYMIPPRADFFSIPRESFNLYSELEINVTAVNIFGNTTSETLKLIPMETVILDPPEIKRVEAGELGCLNYSWSLAKSQEWLMKTLSVELKLKTVNNQLDKELVRSFRQKQKNKIGVCDLLHWTNYSTTMRVKYVSWSKWTPTGSLDTWLKMDDQNVQLYWKTQEHHCFFSLPKKVKTFYLRAINAVGSSDHTLVEMYRIKGQCFVSHFSVHPQSETSLLVKWERLVSPHVTGYVLEWKSLSEKQPAPVSFTLIDKANSSTIITAYKPYNISIYPKYNDWIGCPLTFTAYSSQKAPEVAPELNVTDISHSRAKLNWNEIPLKQRNGIIHRYTVFFWHEANYIRDGIDMVLFVIPACVGLTLIIIIVVFACFGKSERVKMCLWPIIPDPANSSIKSWTDTDPLQGMPPFNEAKEPMLVYLSHFSFLDLSENEPFKSDYVKENQWSHDIDSHDESRSSFQTCVRYDTERDRDSVPYATVVFGGPYQNHSSCVPTYVRSESTQPLLGSDDPGSPPPYENVSPSGSVSKVPRFTAFPQNSTGSEENEELWEEFPMLRSLEIRDTDHV